MVLGNRSCKPICQTGQQPGSELTFTRFQSYDGTLTQQAMNPKKRSQRDRIQQEQIQQGSMSGNTTATTSVNSGEPSPTHMGVEAMGSMDSVHRYVPEYVPVVSTRKTAV